jgi:hypothetical protein
MTKIKSLLLQDYEDLHGSLVQLEIVLLRDSQHMNQVLDRGSYSLDARVLVLHI